MYRFILIACIIILTISCAPGRRPIPAGVIPDAPQVDSQDELYGKQVLQQLSRQFPISHDAYQNERVQKLVDRLTRYGTSSRDYWKVYVLSDDSVKNAAATRGEYVFVWSGMLRAVPSDSELAAVVSHEIGHVLAGHTKATPGEEANQMISGTAGQAAGSLLGGIEGQIAQTVLSQVLQGFLVNPESQRKEYEADQIGLFIMADAGYDPRSAIDFWTRASSDPNFTNSSLEFLSTHPSSENRLERLRALLPEAERRFDRRRW